MNCPTVPPTGSGIQVQLPPSLYKASHVSSVNFRLQLMVNSLQPQKQHIAHQYTTLLDVHHKFSISHYKSEPELQAKMRLALHTVICCCVFTTVLPLVKGATGEINTSLKKRFRAWLHSRMKRDLCNSSMTIGEQHSDVDVEPPQDGNADIVLPSSSGLNIRPRRSASPKSTGCALVTCAYHDLLHQLYLENEHKRKEDKAPENKMSSKGYGRRRRSLPTPLFLLTGRQRRSTEVGQRLCGHESTIA